MEHDIPQEGNDYENGAQWLSDIAAACERAKEPPECLPLDPRFYVKAPGGEDREPMDENEKKELDPDYRGKGRYDSCTVTRVDPPSQPATVVPSGTSITVEIVCERVEKIRPGS